MWDYNKLFFWVSSSSFQSIGLNVFLKWICFVSECTSLWALVPHHSNTALRESCVIIYVMMLVCSSWIFIKNICASGWSAPRYHNWATATSYLDPVMLGIYSFLSEILLLKTCALLGFPLGVLVSCPGMCVVLCFPALVLFWWVLLLRGTILLWRFFE